MQYKNKGSKCLITSSRNQAVEAILEKVRDFGVLIFGNDDRLGPIGKLNTLSGRLKRDPEVLFWDRVTANISERIRGINKIETDVWTKNTINFPGLAILKKKAKTTIEGPNGAQMWFDALKKILPEISMKIRLKKGFKRIKKWKDALCSLQDKAHYISSAVLSLKRIHIIKTSRIYL